MQDVSPCACLVQVRLLLPALLPGRALQWAPRCQTMVTPWKLPPQGSKGQGREVKAISHDSLELLRAAHLVQPLTSRDRTLLGSSSSRVKMSPRFTVNWDPSSNSTCQGAQF